MTIASSPILASTRRQRAAFGRYGTAGSLALWALTLAGVPFYVLIALGFGLVYAGMDRARALRRLANRAAKQLRGHAMPVADNLGTLIGRLRAGADSAFRPIIDRRGDHLVISLPHGVAFLQGTATPSLGARDLLARLARAVAAGSWRIDVIGYGDAPAPGSLERSLSPAGLLSALRARVAVDALRAAGCRGPIAVIGAPANGRLQEPDSGQKAPQEPAALDIVIRGGERGARDAA